MATRWASTRPSILGGPGGIARGLHSRAGHYALGDEGLADAGDGVDVHAEGGGDVGVDAVAAEAVAIAQEQDLGMMDLLGRC